MSDVFDFVLVDVLVLESQRLEGIWPIESTSDVEPSLAHLPDTQLITASLTFICLTSSEGSREREWGAFSGDLFGFS